MATAADVRFLAGAGPWLTRYMGKDHSHKHVKETGNWDATHNLTLQYHTESSCTLSERQMFSTWHLQHPEIDWPVSP